MEKSNFTLICLHVLKDCLKDYRKVLKDDEYFFFNNWYQLLNGKIVKNDSVDFERNFFGENISIQAVVGKNGSGKSSLFELIYRIVNNLSYVTTEGLYRGQAEPIYFIRNLRAEIYFELNGKLGRVTCHDDIVDFVYGDEVNRRLFFPASKNYQDEDERSNIRIGDTDAITLANYHDLERQREICNTILNHFFFVIVVNYSLQSLNPCDYEYEEACGYDDNDKCVDSWLMSLYNKNDGYMVPIGFEPYRGYNRIDLHIQKELARDRIASLLLDAKKNNHQILPGYKCEEIDFSLNMNFITNKKSNDDDLSQNIKEILEDLNSDRCQLIIKGFDISDKHDFNEPESLLLKALTYLINKTFHISENYPGYEKFSELGKKFYDLSHELSESDKELMEELVDKVYNEYSHIGVKINQVLHFIDGLLVAPKEFKETLLNDRFEYEDYINSFFSTKNIDNPDEIMKYYPPSIFEHTIFLRDESDNTCIKIGDLSAGERQYLYTTAAYIYHLRNLISVPNDGSRLKYTNVCLFLDEIELCFHPEYQRTFIHQLLQSLIDNKINEECNINIILSTHSPFVLSDIPKSNILFLQKGEIVNDKVKFNPFGSNVSDLLSDSFFLENGFVGEFAKEKINSLIYYLEKGENQQGYNWSETTAKQCIDLIGDPLLHNMLTIAYGKKYMLKDARIKALENEIKKICNEEN